MPRKKKASDPRTSAQEFFLFADSYMRQLLPYVFVSHVPIGWKCSECGQVFRLLIGNSQLRQWSTSEPAASIEKEFIAHTCSPTSPQFGQLIQTDVIETAHVQQRGRAHFGPTNSLVAGKKKVRPRGILTPRTDMFAAQQEARL